MNSMLKTILRPPYKFVKYIYHTITGTQPKGIVYMLHRCAPKDSSALLPNENMKVYPEILDSKLAIAKKKYKCIHITQVEDYIKHFHIRPFCVFTFDDGYKDNYEFAYPLFKKHQIPFTIFIATSFPEKNNIMWWFSLEELVLNNDHITLTDGAEYFCNTYEEKIDTFMSIRKKILTLNQQNLENELNCLFQNYTIDWYKPVKSLAMDWDEIHTLAKDPLVTLGGHTYHHYNLKELPSVDAVKEEIQCGLEMMRNHSISVSTFAYPFGTENEVSQREIDILTNNSWNISSAYIARGGSVNRKNIKKAEMPRTFLDNQTDISIVR